MEDTLALFYVIEEGGRIRPKHGYGVDEVPHCKQMLKDMRDNRKHEMQENLKRFASGGSQRPHSFVGGTDQENLKRFPPVDSQRHHTLVGGTNQGPESQRTLWVPEKEPRKEVMVSLHQDRAELHGERRGGADLPPLLTRAELRGECREGADFPPSASSLNWAGSNRDAYHFLGAAAGRDNELTTTVNRDLTEDYDHVSKVTPISLKRTEYFQQFARDPYMPTLTVTAKKLNEPIATAVQYGMPFISTDAGESPNLNQADVAKVRYPEKALAQLRAATEAVRTRPGAESQVALFEAIVVMVKALAMALTLRVSRTLTPQVGAGLLNIWTRLVQGEFNQTLLGALMNDVLDQEMLNVDHQWNAMMAYYAFKILPAEIGQIHRNRFEMTQQGSSSIQEFARVLCDRSKNIEYKDELDREKDKVRVYQKGLTEENQLLVYRHVRRCLRTRS